MCLAWFGLSFGCSLRSQPWLSLLPSIPGSIPQSGPLARPTWQSVRRGLIWEQVVVDAHDPDALGEWWAEARGRDVVGDAAVQVEIRPTPTRLPGLVVAPVPEGKGDEPRTDVGVRDSWSAANRVMTVSMERRLGLGRDPSAAVAQHVEAAVGSARTAATRGARSRRGRAR